MLISDTKKAIFIHNPKCGGTSVRRQLSAIDTRNDKFWMFREIPGPMIDRNVKIDLAHMPLAILEYYYPDEYSLMSKYFVFTFVRSPLPRLISAFRESSKNYESLSKDRYISLFKQYVEKRIHSNELDFLTRHAIRQELMIYNDKKNMIDVIVKVEEVESGLKKIKNFDVDIFRLLKAPYNSNLNRSSTNLISDQSLYNTLDKKLQEDLKNYYRRDCELFQYDWKLDVYR